MAQVYHAARWRAVTGARARTAILLAIIGAHGATALWWYQAGFAMGFWATPLYLGHVGTAFLGVAAAWAWLGGAPWRPCRGSAGAPCRCTSRSYVGLKAVLLVFAAGADPGWALLYAPLHERIFGPAQA